MAGEWRSLPSSDAESSNKELKLGFGMDRMPWRNLRANSVWLELGVPAHNLAVGVRRLLLGGEWATKTIGIRARLGLLPAPTC